MFVFLLHPCASLTDGERSEDKADSGWVRGELAMPTSLCGSLFSSRSISTRFILDLIEAKITGCFDLLDEESRLPTPKAEHFTSEVHNRNKNHPRLDVRESPALLTFIYRLSSPIRLASTKVQAANITRDSRWRRFPHPALRGKCGLLDGKTRLTSAWSMLGFVSRPNFSIKTTMLYTHLF